VAYRQSASGFVELADAFSLVQIVHMDNQWVEARSSLRFVNSSDRFGIRCVGGEAINRLCGDGHGFARKDQPCCLGDAFVGKRQNPRLHEQAATGFRLHPKY
jgi:hypothetical protein